MLIAMMVIAAMWVIVSLFCVVMLAPASPPDPPAALPDPPATPPAPPAPPATRTCLQDCASIIPIQYVDNALISRE